MNRGLSNILFFLALLIGVGCADRVENSRTQPLSGVLSFAEMRRQVFQTRCLPCHGSAAGLDCQTYAAVKSRLDKIERRVMVEKNMPPNGPLPPAEMKYLESWMQAGAPEGKPETPPPPQEPLAPNYRSIDALIFRPLCIGCHSKTGKAFTVPLEPLSDLLKSPRQIVVPGDLENSNLIFSLARKDKKKMPPPESGVRPVTPQELDVIRQWVLEGAKP